MLFPESAIAHRYLDGLKGIEIGGSAHNPFNLDTINCDRLHHTDSAFKTYAKEQMKLCGSVMPVDVVCRGDELPFADKAYDFVVSSHVLEHFYDPIGALIEWRRVARKYILVIVPKRNALLSDRDLPVTRVIDLVNRHKEGLRIYDDIHHTRFTITTFHTMCDYLDMNIVETMETDDKAGNGHLFVIEL
jgi:SAM-dependent methyltransferase